MRSQRYSWLVVLLVLSFLAGCAPVVAPAPQVIKETVQVPVEVTRVVEQTVQVEVTRIVEPQESAAAPATAAEAGPVTLEIYDPTGAQEITELHAARLDGLDGKVICALSNDSWQAHRVLPAVQEALQDQYPSATMVPYTEFPVGTETVDLEETAKAMAERGCQAVIIGDAG